MFKMPYSSAFCQGNLYATIGLARSGKSTLANKWLHFAVNILDNCDWTDKYVSNGKENPRVVVCSDDIRLALYGERFRKEGEEAVHAIQGVMIRSLLYRGHDVLVDGTHTTENSLMRLLRIDPRCRFVYVDTSPEECKEIAVKTEQIDLIPVIDRMYANLQDLCMWAVSRENINKEIEVLRNVFSNK